MGDSSSGLLPDVPVAQHNEFLAGQSFQSHRAARVDLVGGDADFRAEAILEPIGEAGGCIDHHRTGIHLAQETAGAAIILGNDRIGMLRTIGGDVLDGLIEPVHHPHAQDRRQILGVPVFFRRFASFAE